LIRYCLNAIGVQSHLGTNEAGWIEFDMAVQIV